MSIRLAALCCVATCVFNLGRPPVATAAAAAAAVGSPGGVPPDFSRGYFSHLKRPAAPRVAIDAAGGPVILIVVDALRPDHLTPYGYERDTSPVLAKLADDGVILTNFYANGNWTRPTTASLLTGALPWQHGVEGERDKLADVIVTLPEILQRAGVPTGAVIGNGNAGSAFGLQRGFSFYADTVGHWDGLPAAADVFAEALPFVTANRHQPFFLMLFLVDPHDPYHAPSPYEDMFVADPQVPLIRTPHWEARHYTPAQIERMTAAYDGAVRYTDAAIGRFFDVLQRLDIYDRATIIVTADHGEAFGEHGVFLHSHHLYDEIIRAPLIMRAPQMSRRGVYNHYLFQTVDLLPTVLGLLGVSRDSISPRMADAGSVDIVSHLAVPQNNSRRRVVLSEFNNFGIRRRTLRTYWTKLVYDAPADRQEFMEIVGDAALLPSVSFEGERFRAYDLVGDPFERRDLWRDGRAIPARWRPLVEQLIKAAAAAAPEGESRDVDAGPQLAETDRETYEDLRALGYVQ